VRYAIAAGVLTASLMAGSAVNGQSAPVAPIPAAGATQAAEPARDPGGVWAFVRDVGGDYKQFFSWSTVKWLGVGGLAAAAIHPADEAIRDATQDPDEVTILSETAGEIYGDFSLQLPLAVTWWIVGHGAGSSRAAATGRDLVRAQINEVTWTNLIKYSVNRTRPNGGPRSFPSGHTSATFATAMVLQEHYGWRVGVPFFAAAIYTGASRIVDNRHWASDVMFGAFLGMTSGRTVTVHLRRTPVSIAPVSIPGGGVAINFRRAG